MMYEHFSRVCSVLIRRCIDAPQAMKDFQTMFPDMDPDVIEAVLRANNGIVHL